jgi:delta8-fatty-acid desaturase
MKSDLFQTNYFWYAKLMVIQFVMFFVAIYCATFDDLLVNIFSALLLGFFWQQLAFIGHDLCHNAVTHSRYWDSMLSCLLAVFKGVGAQWWKHTHNVHHVVTNSLEFDPDIQHLPVIAVTEKYFENVKSLFHNKILAFDAFGKFFVSFQHYLYYPWMGFSRWNLYAQSFMLHFHSKDPIPFKTLDFVSLVLFWTWYLALLSQLSSYPRIFIYMLCSHIFGPGLLAIQITISHFAMPVYEDIESSKEYKFLETQFEHSMDVDCSPWLDWLHGGLQFQAVHHLLPRVPRHNLRHVRDKYVVPFAKKWNFKYNINTFWRSNLLVLETLSGAAEKARKFPPENLAAVWKTDR